MTSQLSSYSSSAQFVVHPTKNPTSQADLDKILATPGFGDYFTDHMVAIDYEGEAGDGQWKNPRVEPYGPITMDPSTAVLHYGQEVFEGLKAFRHDDNSIWSFRPEENAHRFRRSAVRMELAELPEDLFMQSLVELLTLDSPWVPSGDGQSLYMRPFMYASERFLGVRPTHKTAYRLIATPSDNYFGEVKPIKIWLSEEYARAGKGGTGMAKCGGNYAASMIAQRQGAQNGCAQVVFRDFETDAIEELGGMNIFFVFSDGSVATPALNGTILEGITRDSVLTLLRDAGVDVEERDITVQEWKDGVQDGTISEIFACGTAASIAPIGQLVTAQGSYGDVPYGQVTKKIREQILGIQRGTIEDPYGWMTKLVG